MAEPRAFGEEAALPHLGCVVVGCVMVGCVVVGAGCNPSSSWRISGDTQKLGWQPATSFFKCGFDMNMRHARESEKHHRANQNLVLGPV